MRRRNPETIRYQLALLSTLIAAGVLGSLWIARESQNADEYNNFRATQTRFDEEMDLATQTAHISTLEAHVYGTATAVAAGASPSPLPTETLTPTMTPTPTRTPDTKNFSDVVREDQVDSPYLEVLFGPEHVISDLGDVFEVFDMIDYLRPTMSHQDWLRYFPLAYLLEPHSSGRDFIPGIVQRSEEFEDILPYNLRPVLTEQNRQILENGNAVLESIIQTTLDSRGLPKTAFFTQDPRESDLSTYVVTHEDSQTGNQTLYTMATAEGGYATWLTIHAQVIALLQRFEEESGIDIPEKEFDHTAARLTNNFFTQITTSISTTPYLPVNYQDEKGNLHQVGNEFMPGIPARTRFLHNKGDFSGTNRQAGEDTTCAVIDFDGTDNPTEFAVLDATFQGTNASVMALDISDIDWVSGRDSGEELVQILTRKIKITLFQARDTSGKMNPFPYNDETATDANTGNHLLVLVKDCATGVPVLPTSTPTIPGVTPEFTPPPGATLTPPPENTSTPQPTPTEKADDEDPEDDIIDDDGPIDQNPTQAPTMIPTAPPSEATPIGGF